MCGYDRPGVEAAVRYRSAGETDDATALTLSRVMGSMKGEMPEKKALIHHLKQASAQAAPRRRYRGDVR
jgi:hypothetical protein